MQARERHAQQVREKYQICHVLRLLVQQLAPSVNHYNHLVRQLNNLNVGHVQPVEVHMLYEKVLPELPDLQVRVLNPQCTDPFHAELLK
ncbi:MAG: hypothetical protein NVSMB70_19420 [Chamaesiphon sp.]